MRPLHFAPALLFTAFAFAPACSSSSPADTTATALFHVPSALTELDQRTYLDHPWPSDLRRDPDGSVHVDGIYDPRSSPLIKAYLAATKGLLKGFSPAAAAYFRFTAPIDPATLPADPKATQDRGASVQFIDVDTKSPERGQRRVAETYFRKDEGVYWLPNTLAVMPALGYPLRPHTTYAIVVTRAVHGERGGAVKPSDELSEVLGVRPASKGTEGLRAAWAPAIAEIENAGVARADIAHMTVFTTSDPTEELLRLVDDVHANVTAPTVDASTWKRREQKSTYEVYEGIYGPSPNYQAGKIPFEQLGDGGSFVFDANGKPVVQSTFTLRFTLVVPRAATCPPPPTGYPIAIYAHGTGGDYRSVVNEGNSVGSALAAHCIASIGTDQIFHGARAGAPPADDPHLLAREGLLYSNINNPLSLRTNPEQSAIDVVQEARLFTDTHLTIPASVSRTGAAIAFDGSDVLLFGHSQGATNGSIFLAIDKAARGGVLSGAGAMNTVYLLERLGLRDGLNIPGLIKALLGLTGAQGDELNVFHPLLNWEQLLADPGDPIHYMRLIIREPRGGAPSKSVFQTEGAFPDHDADSFVPDHMIELASVALGVPREAPGVHTIREAAFGGLGDVTVPADGLSGNLAGGRATGILSQYQPTGDNDGHFVIFDDPVAREQAATFCRNLADDAKGKVPARTK